ncbi:MAG: T9SS type A sorting domain-containing protein, partial [Chlorobi bacterium]|nr:T9SS type A sorting domain-containing protein [Chlorobiota bacterium]
VDVLIDPVDTNIVYVSCGNLGSPGMGIYRSTDGGSEGSWKKLGGGLPKSWTGKTLLALFESSPNIIYADVADMFKSIGLYRSTDRGDTWKLISSNDVARYQGWYSHYVRVDPRDENQIIYAGVSFYYSEDGGKTLKKNNRMHVDHHAYANHPTNPDIVYFANDGGVYRTLDGGRTFQSLSDGYVTTQFYNGFSSSPTNPDLALGGLQDNSTVMYTGSPRWITGLIGGDGAYTAINPLDNNTMYGSIQWLRIYRSRDRGNSWENISKKLTDSQALFIAPYVLAPSQPQVIYAGKRVVYRSSDGGDTWTVTNASAPLNGMPVISIAVSHTNPDVVYAATVPDSKTRAEVFVSTNGGADWTNITDGLPDRYYVDMQVSPTNDSIVYITLSGFNSSHLFRSTDRGTSWEDVGRGLPDVPTSAVAIDPDFPSRLYVGNDLGVFVSTNDGASWLPLAEGLPSAVLVMDLSISRANRRIRAVTHGNGVYERPLLTPIVNVEDRQLAAASIIHLDRNYPNPFGPRSSPASMTTRITFTLARPASVSLRIFNLAGREIRVLASGRYQAGKHAVSWDGTTGQGSPASSGTYLYQLQVGSTVLTEKLLYLR